MAAIMAASMAAIKTTKRYNFWTAQPILLKFGRNIYYMILHMINLLGYTNSRWPLSWLPIWPPLKQQNPITFEPLSRFCSNLVVISIIWSYICSICWVTKFKMAAIMAVNMAANKTTKPYNFWTAQPILLKFGSYIYYMILHMFHLLGYTNLRWPPSWLPVWPPLKLQNPITFEPLSRICSNLVDISTIWSYICSICWVAQIQDDRHHGCQFGRH